MRIAFWGGDNDIDINNRLAAAFEAEYPDIKVELLHTPDSYDDKIRTMMVGGAAPDIVMLAESFGSYANGGWLMPLDSLIANDPDFDMDDFFPLVVDAYRVDGALYTLPMRWGPMILYYNKELFDHSAVAFPTRSGIGTPFWKPRRSSPGARAQQAVWHRLDRRLVALVDGAHLPKRRHESSTQTRTETLMHQPEAIEALQWYRDLIWEHGISPNYVEWEYFPGKGPDQLFESGITAMNQTGFWAAYWLRMYNAFDWDVSVLPMQKARATPLFSNGWAITSQSQHPKEAWELIKFLTSERRAAPRRRERPRRPRPDFGRPGVLHQSRSATRQRPADPGGGGARLRPARHRAMERHAGADGSRRSAELLRNETSVQQAVATFKPAVDAMLQEIAPVDAKATQKTAGTADERLSMTVTCGANGGRHSSSQNTTSPT